VNIKNGLITILFIYFCIGAINQAWNYEIGLMIFTILMIWLLFKASFTESKKAKNTPDAKLKNAPVEPKHSQYEYAQAFPEAPRQGDVRKAELPAADTLVRANQAMLEATVKPESRWPTSLRIFDIGLLADSISERSDKLMVGLLPYIIAKHDSSYVKIQFTLFDHLAHTRGQWSHLYQFRDPYNLATPPASIRIPINDIDDRWTLDMRVDGILFAIYHVNPAEIVDGITDIGEITTRIGADGEIDTWARLAAAKSESNLSLDDLLDAPITSSNGATHEHRSRNT
jgi:hypothetical protein